MAGFEALSSDRAGSAGGRKSDRYISWLSRRSERRVCGTPASLSGGDHDGVHTAATGDELDGDRYNGHRRDGAFVAGDNRDPRP